MSQHTEPQSCSRRDFLKASALAGLMRALPQSERVRSHDVFTQALSPIHVRGESGEQLKIIPGSERLAAIEDAKGALTGKFSFGFTTKANDALSDSLRSNKPYARFTLINLDRNHALAMANQMGLDVSGLHASRRDLVHQGLSALVWSYAAGVGGLIVPQRSKHDAGSHSTIRSLFGAIRGILEGSGCINGARVIAQENEEVGGAEDVLIVVSDTDPGSVQAVNLRCGPGVDYEKVGYRTDADPPIQAIGRNHDGSWIQVVVHVDGDSSIVWLSGGYVESAEGAELSKLPIVQATEPPAEGPLEEEPAKVVIAPTERATPPIMEWTGHGVSTNGNVDWNDANWTEITNNGGATATASSHELLGPCVEYTITEWRDYDDPFRYYPIKVGPRLDQPVDWKMTLPIVWGSGLFGAGHLSVMSNFRDTPYHGGPWTCMVGLDVSPVFRPEISVKKPDGSGPMDGKISIESLRLSQKYILALQTRGPKIELLVDGVKKIETNWPEVHQGITPVMYHAGAYGQRKDPGTRIYQGPLEIEFFAKA